MDARRKRIAYIDPTNPSNIRVQLLDGTPSRLLTQFTDTRPIADFARSPDGKCLAIARATIKCLQLCAGLCALSSCPLLARFLRSDSLTWRPPRSKQGRRRRSQVSSSAPPVDFIAMRQQLGDDDGLICDLVSLFLDDYPHRVEALNHALATEQADGVRAVAHTIRGGASNLCAVRVVETARALEIASECGDFGVVGGHAQRLVDELGLLSAALREFQAQRLARRSGAF